MSSTAAGRVAADPEAFVRLQWSRWAAGGGAQSVAVLSAGDLGATASATGNRVEIRSSNPGDDKSAAKEGAAAAAPSGARPSLNNSSSAATAAALLAASAEPAADATVGLQATDQPHAFATGWTTVTATDGVSAAFGTVTFGFHIGSVGGLPGHSSGGGGKPVIVGLLPAHTGHGGPAMAGAAAGAASVKLSQIGGFGVGSSGKVYGGHGGPQQGGGAAGGTGTSVAVPSLAFGTGDFVSLRVDGVKGSVTVTVESRHRRRGTEIATFSWPALQGHLAGAPEGRRPSAVGASAGASGQRGSAPPLSVLVVPAASLHSATVGTPSVTLLGVADNTPLELYAQRVAQGAPSVLAPAPNVAKGSALPGPGEADSHVSDALGPFWARLLRRLGTQHAAVRAPAATATGKPSSDVQWPLSKEEIAVRAVLCGPGTPLFSRGSPGQPLAPRASAKAPDAADATAVLNSLLTTAAAAVMSDHGQRERFRALSGVTACVKSKEPRPPGEKPAVSSPRNNQVPSPDRRTPTPPPVLQGGKGKSATGGSRASLPTSGAPAARLQVPALAGPMGVCVAGLLERIAELESQVAAAKSEAAKAQSSQQSKPTDGSSAGPPSISLRRSTNVGSISPGNPVDAAEGSFGRFSPESKKLMSDVSESESGTQGTPVVKPTPAPGGRRQSHFPKAAGTAAPAARRASVAPGSMAAANLAAGSPSLARRKSSVRPPGGLAPAGGVAAGGAKRTIKGPAKRPERKAPVKPRVALNDTVNASKLVAAAKIVAAVAKVAKAASASTGPLSPRHDAGPNGDIDDLNRSLSGSHGAEAAAAAAAAVAALEAATEDAITVPKTSNKILRPINKLRAMMEKLQELGEIGSPSDDDLKAYKQMKGLVGLERQATARTLGALKAADIPVEMLEEARDELGEILQDVVEKGDHEEGVLPLFRALKSIPGFDFAEVVRDRDLHCIAAFDGSIDFLKDILETPNLNIDAAELTQACLYNQSSRIQLTSLLLDYEESLGLASIYEEVEEVWNEFFADIASKKKANDKENRKGRMELVKRILCHPVFKVNMEFEGGDSQTPFTRACRENDAELMTALLADAPNTIDVNRVQSDKLTALHQCVFGDSPEAAKLLLGMPQTDVGIVSPEVGDPLSFAKALGRGKIVKLLS